MRTTMFVIIFVIVFLVVRSSCDLIGDCSPKEDIPCLVYKFKDSDCFSENLKKIFPFYETNTTNFPGSPGSLDSVLSYRYHSGVKKWFPGANLTFTTPQNAAMKSVKGFEITRYDKSNNVACYILDLSNVTWDESSLTQMNTEFSHDLWPLSNAKPAVFVIEAYALPKQEVKEGKYDQYLYLNLNFPGYVPEGDQSPRNWVATIYFSKDSKLGTITVNIVPPPTELGFKLFEYRLVNNATGSSLYRDVTEKTSHQFSKVPTGLYKIQVKPSGPINMPDCPCKDETGQICSSCITTQTREFNFTYTGIPLPVSPTPTTKKDEIVPPVEESTTTTAVSDMITEVIKSTTTESNEVSRIQVAMAIVGTILGIILAVCVAGIIYYHRCRRTDDKEIKDQMRGEVDGPAVLPGRNPAYADDMASVISFGGQFNNENAGKTRFEKRPKLFLLFEDDHEYHRKVVYSFATYLQQHCQCNVMCVEWQLDAAWVHQDLQQADYVVIVNSEGAFLSYMNKYEQRNDSTKQMSSINSIRNKFLHDERYDNIVMVYFDYTDEKYILPDICPGYKYLLPKHFTDFLLHIHKLHRTDNLQQYDLPLDSSHAQRPIGQQFLEAITAAGQFQLKDPKWAHKRFGYDRMYSHVSDDSKFDSGVPEDLGSPVQTPQVERPAPFNDPKEKALMHILDGKSVCTVSPSDLGITLYQQDSNISQPFTEETNVSYGQKNRPRLSPQNFTAETNQMPNEETPSPPTCSTVESDFGFFPPEDLDDDFDVLSKTQSEQMKSIVDRYQENMHVYGNQSVGYDRNSDLLLLKVQSGEVPYITCNMNSDVVSLGGESV